MKVSTLFKHAIILSVSAVTLSGCGVANEIQKAQDVQKNKEFDVICVSDSKPYFHETISDLQYSHHASQYGVNDKGKIVVFMNGCIATEK